MGCDIHLHTEIKINGKWENYGTPKITRNYDLFAKMAGVRRSTPAPIAQPKGLPDDCSTVTAFNAEYWNSDGHHHSYLTIDEIIKLENWYRQSIGDWPEDEWGFLFGDSWGGFTKYPEDRPEGLEDVRFVFWFDN